MDSACPFESSVRFSLPLFLQLQNMHITALSNLELAYEDARQDPSQQKKKVQIKLYSH